MTSTTMYENSKPNQDAETYMVKAVTSRKEAETLIALGYEFHYRTADGVDLFRKKVIGLDRATNILLQQRNQEIPMGETNR